MICSSSEFVNNYLWKYVDMTITKKEWTHLTTKHVHSTEWISFLSKFKHVFNEDADMFNYSFVLSNIEKKYFESFMVFYTTNIQRCLKKIEHCSIKTMDELVAFVEADDEKFKLLLISLYYYF